MTNLVPIFIVLLAIVVIYLNISIHKWILKKAIRKEIVPYLEKKGLTFTGYQDLGILSTGDFKERAFTIVIGGTGNMSTTVYAYLFYNSHGVDKKVTARIDSTLWIITRVTYSAEL